jgi:hypothetical protein
MSIAGHVSRATLHVRMEAKRRALDEVATLQRVTDEKRQEGDAQRQPAATSKSGSCQSESGGPFRSPTASAVASSQWQVFGARSNALPWLTGR